MLDDIVVRYDRTSDRVEINGFLMSPEVIEDMLGKMKDGEVRGFDLTEESPGIWLVQPVVDARGSA